MRNPLYCALKKKRKILLMYNIFSRLNVALCAGRILWVKGKKFQPNQD